MRRLVGGLLALAVSALGLPHGRPPGGKQGTKKGKGIYGANGKEGIHLIEPDTFGQEGRAVGRVEADSVDRLGQAMRAALGAHQAPAKDRQSHRLGGIASGVYYEPKLPVTDREEAGARNRTKREMERRARGVPRGGGFRTCRHGSRRGPPCVYWSSRTSPDCSTPCAGPCARRATPSMPPRTAPTACSRRRRGTTTPSSSTSCCRSSTAGACS